MCSAVRQVAELFRYMKASPDATFAVVAHGSTEDTTHPVQDFSSCADIVKFISGLGQTTERADLHCAPYARLFAKVHSLSWKPDTNRHLIVIGNSVPDTGAFDTGALTVHSIQCTPSALSHDVSQFL